ncbi:hypothetical protein CHH91_18790, partial [Virgibacillus sp. 7505]
MGEGRWGITSVHKSIGMRQKTYSLKPARRRSGFFYDISIDRFVKERLAFYAEAARFFKGGNTSLASCCL